MVEWDEHETPEDRYQILGLDGSLDGGPPELDDEELVAMYRTMVATRQLEDKMLNMQRSGQAGLIARSRGEEATPLGCAAALAPDDWTPDQCRRTGTFIRGTHIDVAMRVMSSVVRR